MQFRRVVLRARHAFGVTGNARAASPFYWRGAAGPFAPLPWCARGACWLYSLFYQTVVWRTEIKFRVTKGDHYGLATAPVILVCYTVVTSRRSVCEGSVWLRRATLSAKGSTKGG